MRVLFISENAPVPADRRVWNEARSLTAAGWEVTIVCAQGADRDSSPYEVLEGIEIHRFPLRASGGGASRASLLYSSTAPKPRGALSSPTTACFPR